MTVEELLKLVKDTVGAEISEKMQDATARGKEIAAKGHVPKLLDAKAKPAFRKHRLAETPAEELTAADKSALAGRCVRYLIANGNNVERAIEHARDLGEKTIVECWEKALGESTLAGGGAILPTEFREGIIEELGPATVMRSMGVSVWPMNTGSLSTPFVADSATAHYKGESQNGTPSQPSFGSLELSDKELICLVPIGNRLLQNGGSAADNVIRQNMLRSMARKEDATFIRGLGGENTPRGMRGWVQGLGQTNVLQANGTVNLGNVTLDLLSLIDAVESADVDLAGAGFVLSTQAKNYLFALRDGNGNLAFRDQMLAGELMGYKWKATTGIPSNLGDAGDESEIYFAAFPSLVIAENEQMSIQGFDGGSYHDGITVQSGVSRNETVVRAVALHDFGAQQRGKEISMLTNVKWNAAA